MLSFYANSFYQEDAWTNYSFEEVFAVIRLAHKYNIADVQKQALYALREYTFNDGFEKWMEDRVERIVVEGPCAIGAVNLARLLDEPEMLVIALYKCLGLGSGILDGWKREDGSVERLSEDDVKRCITANRELSRSSVIAVYKTFRPEPSDECNQKTRCEASLRQTLTQYLDLCVEHISDGSDVMTTRQGMFSELDGFGMCEACWEEVKTRETWGRYDIWIRFPDIFDIEADRWARTAPHPY